MAYLGTLGVGFCEKIAPVRTNCSLLCLQLIHDFVIIFYAWKLHHILQDLGQCPVQVHDVFWSSDFRGPLPARLIRKVKCVQSPLLPQFRHQAMIALILPLQRGGAKNETRIRVNAHGIPSG